MNRQFVTAFLFLVMLLVSCQLSTPTPAEPSATDAAAAIHANQTSTASAQSAQATLTAIAPVPPSPTRDNVFNITVPASACWMNSGVNVLTGQTVTIKASGIVNTWSGNEISNGDPNGQPQNTCGAIECPMQGAKYGALIGRLEDLKPFLVGTDAEFTATKDGQLYFTVNDWECGDNSGEFELNIVVE